MPTTPECAGPCASCSLPIDTVTPGGVCSKCSKAHHLTCMEGPTRALMKCTVCATRAEESRLSLQLPPPVMNSTRRDPTPSAATEALQRQMNELKAMMLTMQTALLGGVQGKQAANFPAPGTSSDRTMGEENTTTDETNNSGRLNRTQAAILQSIRLKPVSKGEQEYRRGCPPLPLFNGDPTTWFVFISTYQETTAQCGFSDRENMERVKAALGQPAKARVECYFGMPHRLQDLLAVLEREYGTPEALVRRVTEMAMATAALRADLSNIAQFYGVVMQIDDALQLLSEPTEHSGLTNWLVEKIGLQRGLEWMTYLGGRRATVSIFREFMDELGRKVMTLQGVTRATSASTSHGPSTAAAKPRQRTMVCETTETTEKKAAGAAAGVDGCSLGCESKHRMDKCPKFQRMSVKERWSTIRRTRRCVCCFDRHYASRCPTRAVCPQEGCERVHHILLHSDQEVTAPTAVHFVDKAMMGAETAYRMVPVIIKTATQTMRISALMDPGASITLIDKGLARKLGLAATPTKIQMKHTGQKSSEKTIERVQFELSTADGTFCESISASTDDDLDLPTQVVTREWLEEEELGDVPVHPLHCKQPQLLIGLDNAVIMRSTESRVGRTGLLIASRTPLGWVVEGRRAIQRCMTTSASDNLNRIVEEYIEAENFGLIADDDVVAKSDDDLRALTMMQRQTVDVGGRYQTGLLWRTDDLTLPYNKPMAVDRHNSFMRKLRREPELHQRLATLMSEYVDKGYARQIRPGQVSEEMNDRTWYLPIFAVDNPNKPEKVRMVWDAAAAFKGTALNDALLTGPDLNSNLVQVLIRFRLGAVAVSGDIKEMFHQVVIREEDRAAQRYLWQGPQDEQVGEYEMIRMTFGAACSPSIAQFVKNLNADRHGAGHPAAVKAIKHNHYVDDWLQSCDTVEEATALARTVRDIHARGGFDMCKWASNSKEFLVAMTGNQSQDDDLEVSQTTSVLGLNWLTSGDCLCFRWRAARFEELLQPEREEMPTKRQLLRMAMSIFDPLGLASFITVLPKVILREAWRNNCAWDEPVSSALREHWIEWKKCLQNIERIAVPRWYGFTESAVELHVFGDASERAIAAAAYVVCRGANDTTRVLCMAKCKVAPLKVKSIPRLELDAAVLATRVLRIVLDANCWTVTRRVMWSDAKDVLYWIRCHKRRYASYVANRIGTILRQTEVDEWRWVPSALNPADYATKYTARETDSALWWTGPPFLDKKETDWPVLEQEPTGILQEEVRAMTVSRIIIRHPLIPPYENFSSWESLVRNAACAMKFVAIMKKRVTAGAVTQEEMAAAKIEIFKDVQKELDSKEIDKLSAFKDEIGVWRMQGRTARALHLPYNARYPVILPKTHQVTRLIMGHFHQYGGHGLHQRVLNEFRQEFVVLHARRLLNSVLRACARCRLMTTKPSQPEMAALPACRLAACTKPFTFTGVDYFGPMVVAIGRRREKRWGVMFTCMTTRAIYLELAYSLSGESCVKAIDSLVARRGCPSEFYSDNGTNFVAAAKIYRGPNGVRPGWRFNPPGSPHMGGSWERLIGTTKRVLESLQLEKTPTEERMRWFLCRAEYLINSRPLTDVPTDPTAEDAITPNDLLLGKPSEGFREEARVAGAEDYLQQRDADVENFWKRWNQEYLPSIAARGKWRTKAVPVATGDVVYLCDRDYRLGWKKGVVVGATRDPLTDQVRQVVVRTADGTKYRRGVHSIAPITTAETPVEGPAVQEGE